MPSYTESEIKILDVNPKKLHLLLSKLGATKVFDDTRTFYSFDYPDHRLRRNQQEIRLTDEGTIKLSFEQNPKNGKKESVKIKVSRKEEALELLKRLGLKQVAKIISHRTSYEYNGVDFDIDTFPSIPPFLEIDTGDTKVSVKKILALLDLENAKPLVISTPAIFELYGKEYYNTKC
ncbi:CYTH domain-containing protein [Candidatus Woesearchaeota archaeon]|nr:CYTH domain-containing protein [Candidatus Woesearchaeota archaeon]